jgi:hypothetical protein
MSTNQLIASLPSEALQHIFAHIERRADVSSCMRVCKSWKVRAQAAASIVGRPLRATQEAALPALYAYLEFKSVASLQQFLKTVEAATSEGRDIAYHIRSLTLPSKSTMSNLPAQWWRELGLAMAGLSAVFMLACNMRVHDTSGMFALTGLPILSRTCANTLQSLRITMHTRASHPALIYLHNLRSLRSLHVDIAESAAQDPSPALVMPAWSFPYLKTFSLIIPKPNIGLSQRMINFLNTRHLPSLRELKIRAAIGLPSIARSYADFFSRLPVLEELGICVAVNCYFYIIPYIPARSLHIEDPELAVVTHLPSSVRDLHITSESFEPTFYTHLCFILAELLVLPKNLEDVHLPPRFVWARSMPPVAEPYTPAPNEDANLPQLLRYAILFQKKCIGLRDGQGNTLDDYLH